jgi:hypothetical protein
MPRLELKSSRSFLAIKRCQRTKSKKVIKTAYYQLSPVTVEKNKSVLLAKHKDTNIPTMMELFFSSAAWF